MRVAVGAVLTSAYRYTRLASPYIGAGLFSDGSSSGFITLLWLPFYCV